MVQVGFSEEIGDYEAKAVIYRTIRSFNSDIGNGVKNSQDQKSSNLGHSSASQGPSDEGYESKQAYGRRLAVHGFVNGCLANRNIGLGVRAHLDELFGLEDELEKRLHPSALRQAVQRHAPAVVDEDLPVIQQGDEDDVVNGRNSVLITSVEL